MTIVRKPREHNRGKPFAKGKKSIAIDQRTGFKHLQRDMVFEPGTGYFVHKDESDGFHNLVGDPLNFLPESMKEPEFQGLRYVSPDVDLSIGAIISAEQLALPSYASVSGQFIQYASTAWIDTENQRNYRFYIPGNSMYIMTRGF